MLNSTVINRRLIEDLDYARATVEIARVRDMLDSLEHAWKVGGVDYDENHPELHRFLNAVSSLTGEDSIWQEPEEFEDRAGWVVSDEQKRHEKAIQTAQDAVKARYHAKYPSLAEAA